MAGRPSSRQAARDFAVSQIALYNELGIDPVQADPRTLALMVALCGTAAAVAGALEPEAPRTVQGFCSVVAKAAAPAA